MSEATVAGYASRLVQVREAGKPEDILAVLGTLADLPITVAVLRETNIGRVVNNGALRQHSDARIREAAAALVQRWMQAALESRGVQGGGAAAGAAPAGQPQAEPVSPPPKDHAARAAGSSEKQPQQRGGPPVSRNAKAAGGGREQPQQQHGEARRVDEERGQPSPVAREMSAREYLAQFRAGPGKGAAGAAAAGRPQKPRRAGPSQAAGRGDRQQRPQARAPPKPPQAHASSSSSSTKRKVVQAFGYMQEKTKAPKLVAPVFGPQPERPRRGGRTSGFFCFTYYKGECGAGSNCQFAHVKSAGAGK